MSHYKPYPAYKDSGVEWLGEVPEHWRVSSVKWEFDAQLGKMLQPERKAATDIQVPYHKAVSVQWEKIADEAPETMWASSREVETYRVCYGDLLICEGGDVGRAAIYCDDDAAPVIIQNSVHRVRPKKLNKNSSLLRLLQSCRSAGWFDVLCSKATIVHFTAEKLGDLAFPVAPASEQQAIATHLDRETTRIDALIAKKTRFIELLKEKRQALITQAVTKGLNPNVKMKDSGVEWLGEVPEHWGVSPLKYIASLVSGGTPSKEMREYWDGDVPWASAKDLKQDKLADTQDHITMYAISSNVASLVPAGCILVVVRGMILARTFPVSEAMVPMAINQDLKALITKRGFHSGYLANLLRGLATETLSRLEEAGHGTKALRMENWVSIQLPIPPIDEQQQIFEFIERETTRLDLLVYKSEHSITLLKERRSALITAAVTGQIDLREAA